MGKLVGAKVESTELIENNRFIFESKEAAKKHEWLYQCTTVESLKNILKSREIWLSNLKSVNDSEEVKRITIPEFERSFFVACFTYSDDISKDHWKEYGKEENGVLYGFKEDWVLKKAELIRDSGDKVRDDDFKIYSNFDEAIKATWDASIAISKRICHPYYICDFGFYQIIYNDDLKREMSGKCALNFGDSILNGGRFITPGAVGIIKNTHGMCKRPNAEVYDKDWTTEKEVRLKVGIKSNYDQLPEKVFFPKMAVKLKEEAFSELRIRFSPLMTEENRNRNIKDLKELLSNAVVNVLD